MLFVLTNSGDRTADYLCRRMTAEAIPFVRFDTDQFSESLVRVRHTSDGTVLRLGNRDYAPAEFDHVWMRRPKPLSWAGLAASPEGSHIVGEWSEAIEGFLAQIPVDRWMNHPARNATASHKIEQLARAGSMGLAVPRTLVTQARTEFKDFWELCGHQVIVKPLSSGYIERAAPETDSLIYANAVSPHDFVRLKDLERCPTLFQERIDKACDIRITVVDGGITAVRLTKIEGNGVQRLDIRRDNMRDVRYDLIQLPSNTEARVLNLVRSYGLRFAAVDMAVTRGGDWVFFEVNPNGQWAWFDIEGVSDIAAHFIDSFAGPARIGDLG